MQVKFNEEVTILNQESTLLQLLVNKQLGDKKGIAVAVNNEVISRSQWHEYILQPNENIIVFTAAQGG